MEINQYIEAINRKYQSGISSEHSYRGEFERLFTDLVGDVEITNEPANVTDCGNPDYVITKGKIPIGYIEAKDIGKDLNSKSFKEQFDRYKKALDNLIIMDYLWFQFFQNGVLVHEVRIGEIEGGNVKSLKGNFETFKNFLIDFSTYISQSIKSSKKLAEMMAGKARMLQDTLEKAVTSDEKSEDNTSLRVQYEAFKRVLIHDLKPKGFADIYAQTLAYGMFAARLHDPTLDDFSRQEAAELIPKSNPFLRRLFEYVAGANIDERIRTTVDNLAEVFRATNIEELLKNFGKSTQSHDPIIHFYETFLAEYDPKLRKARGVWYTPEPIVKFIVQSVDLLLKAEFGLEQGLCDTSKTSIMVDVPTHDRRFKQGVRKVRKDVHKVQILDPATGTGTFLAEVIKCIYEFNFKSIQGAWNTYVESDLIPRLNGFELLMASYAMAHLKLDMLLAETGYRSENNQRLNIYLTNSLEEYHPDTGTLFSNWLSTEANDANHIKRDSPVMVVIGNPPYSLSSSNKGTWIESLIAEYKNDLQEQNLNALSDDYVKFIRYAQYLVDKNGSGIVAMITNNSFIDGITQRQMRKSLFGSFDKIYIYDLHGSAKRKEKAPDGSKDVNVFDIQQGVSISIMIKKENHVAAPEVYHFDSYGSREVKYGRLLNHTVQDISWNKVYPKEPYFFLVPKDDTGLEKYDKGFRPTELFVKYGNGIKFRKDNLLVKHMYEREDVNQLLKDMSVMEEAEVYNKYDTNPTSDWNFEEKKKYFIENDLNNVIQVEYRQFDKRFTYYPLETVNEIIVRGDSRRNLMKNYLFGENIGLVIGRQGQVVGDMPWNLIFVSKYPTDMNIFYRGGGINFPLFVYTEQNNQYTTDEISRISNLSEAIIKRFEQNIGLEFQDSTRDTQKTFTPFDIFDYIYATLHSPTYRSMYDEFLKIDFPKIPYPKDKTIFYKMVELGRELRKTHLLEDIQIDHGVCNYPEDGNNIVSRKLTKNSIGYEAIDEENGKIWINDTQFFKPVSKIAWEFYIGGYQPAQKWLKDRYNKKLSYADIMHYQKIIQALIKTDRLMKEIDSIEFG